MEEKGAGIPPVTRNLPTGSYISKVLLPPRGYCAEQQVFTPWALGAVPNHIPEGGTEHKLDRVSDHFYRDLKFHWPFPHLGPRSCVRRLDNMLDPQRYIDVFPFPTPLPQHSLERPPDPLCLLSPLPQHTVSQVSDILLLANGTRREAR